MNDKSFEVMFVLLMVLTICIWGLYGFVAYKVVGIAQDAIEDGGAKKIIEQVWCGKNGC